MSTNRELTLAQLVGRALDARIADLRVALPAKIVAFDAETQLAAVQPLLSESHFDDTETEIVEPLPVISNVPVQFPGSGGYRLTFPVQAGDPCWLSFADRSTDKWRDSDDQVDPVDLRRHALSDAVALLGVHGKAKVWTGVASDGLTLGKDGGLQVVVKAGSIGLGEAAPADAVAMAAKVTSQLTALKTALNSWIPVPGDGGTALKTILTALFATWPGGVGSASVKVKD